MKTIRYGIFETNSSSTHALVILSKEDYKAWQNNKKTLNLHSGQVQDLTDEDKKIIRNEDGSVDYDGQHFKSEYSFMESDYDYVIDDNNASAKYIESFAEVEQKELGDNVIMSIYRGDRW